MWRRQLPVYSPLSAAAIGRAMMQGLGLTANGPVGLSAVLEREYAAEQAVLFASGTQALQVALRLAMRQVGDAAVALPSFSCFDVASAAIGAGARLRFYDLDPATLTPDLDSLQRVLERGTRVTVISHLYGFPVDWDAVARLHARYDAIAIEDAAQGDQAQWRGRILGSLGCISVLSFGRGKGWTGGSGGALLVRERRAWRGLQEALTDVPAGRPNQVAEARVVGGLVAQWTLGRPAWFAVPQAIPWLRLGETSYKDPTPPQPMTRAAAACLMKLRPTAEQEAGARRATAETILAAIGSGSRVRPVLPLPGATPGYLRLPVRLADGLAGLDRPAAATKLGLAPSYPVILAVIPQVRPWVDGEARRLPGGEELARSLFTVPTHSLLSGAERTELIELLQAYERRPA
jgi:dTDP-4-amino-4,6-dideoxygalactose transaminase